MKFPLALSCLRAVASVADFVLRGARGLRGAAALGARLAAGRLRSLKRTTFSSSETLGWVTLGSSCASGADGGGGGVGVSGHGDRGAALGGGVLGGGGGLAPKSQSLRSVRNFNATSYSVGSSGVSSEVASTSMSGVRSNGLSGLPLGPLVSS